MRVVAVCAIVAFLAWVSEQALDRPATIDAGIAEARYFVASPVPTTTAVPIPTGGVPQSTSTAPAASRVDGPAVVVAPPERGVRLQVTPTEPPAPRPPVDGDCESWRPLLDQYGIPYDGARPRMVRESQCSNAVNLNAGTGDASYGPLQVNRFGSLARWWDSGGYTLAVMTTAEGAVAAAAVLYRSCGWGPWDSSRGYPCDGEYLQTPEPRWGAW